jgi:Domain of unknown function (DUF1990)
VPLRAPHPTPGSGVARTRVVLRWPLGLLRVIWRYLWRTTPIHRSEEPGDRSDLPAPLPPEIDDDGLQTPADGFGPLLHRYYAVDAVGATQSPHDIVGSLCSEPNWGTPGDVAVFVKMRGERGEMALGDEYVVRMPGPWDGPVRVIARTPTSFRFATMRGHLEAGQIEFRAATVDDVLRFEIESWARSGDRFSHLLYNGLLLAKEIQLNLWMETCLQVAARSGGRLRGGVQVRTRRLDDPQVE